MAVFSNDFQTQLLWIQADNVRRALAVCPPTVSSGWNITPVGCPIDYRYPEIGENGRKAFRTYADCETERQAIRNKNERPNPECPILKNRLAVADSNLADKVAKNTKEKEAKNTKDADAAAEQRIIDRRANEAKAACAPGNPSLLIPNKYNVLGQECKDAKDRTYTGVTFAEIAAERGQSNLAGARANPAVARTLARPARTPRPRLPRPKPAPRVPKKPVLRAKRVSSASSG